MVEVILVISFVFFSLIVSLDYSHFNTFYNLCNVQYFEFCMCGLSRVRPYSLHGQEMHVLIRLRHEVHANFRLHVQQKILFLSHCNITNNYSLACGTVLIYS